MKVILLGATGMVGQGVLRECLLAPDVEAVLVLGRRATGRQHDKLKELVRADLTDLAPVEAELRGYDACFFCLGVSSVGMTEADYRRVTYDLTMSVAGTLARLNPGMTFTYVSGHGTDATAAGRVMWARVKGETENALQRLPFKAVMFRPGLIQAMHGARPSARGVRVAYAILHPVLVLIRWLFPRLATSTEKIGRSMLRVAREGAPKPVLESADINALG